MFTDLLRQHAKQTGDFFVRRRHAGNDDEFVLVLWYNNKPTHHLMRRGEDRVWTINKKPFVPSTELKEVSKAKVAS